MPSLPRLMRPPAARPVRVGLTQPVPRPDSESGPARGLGTQGPGRGAAAPPARRRRRRRRPGRAAARWRPAADRRPTGTDTTRQPPPRTRRSSLPAPLRPRASRLRVRLALDDDHLACGGAGRGAPAAVGAGPSHDPVAGGHGARRPGASESVSVTVTVIFDHDRRGPGSH